MRRSFVLVAALPLLLASAGAPAPRKVCWPLSYAGLTLDVSTESQMRRLLGDGVFRPHDGDTGGRIVINSARNATLHAVFYTDKLIGELTISRGIEPGLTKSEQARAVSAWFDPEEGFGNQPALRLGSTKNAVLANLGTPEAELSSNEWSYSTLCACELDRGFTITFRNDRIVKIVFQALPG